MSLHNLSLNHHVPLIYFSEFKINVFVAQHFISVYCLLDKCLSFFLFPFSLHCLSVFDLLIYGLLLSLWYLQTFTMKDRYVRRFKINVVTSIFVMVNCSCLNIKMPVFVF